MARKKRPEGTRAPNGTGSIYLGKDGKWHGRVTMGVRDDGKPDRRHVQAATEKEVIRKVRKLERQRDTGNALQAGRPWTLTEWLEHWHGHISVPPAVRRKTWSYYHTAVVHYLIPRLGAHKLPRLEPEHIEKLYSSLAEEGKGGSTILQVHRTLRAALNEAYRRGRIPKSPMDVVRTPSMEERDIESLTIEETQRILDAASDRHNGVRFIVALTLGIRQGEALAMRWRYVDLEEGTARFRYALQRQTWQHGCGGACGRKRGAECPQRHGGGLVEVPTKSKAGKRDIGIPEPLVQALRVHHERQQHERFEAGTEWSGEDWVFTDIVGKPIDPRRDYDEWLEVLHEADVRQARLHDARHTMATMLLVLNVPSRAVMGVMGWSQESMLRRYQDVPKEVLDRIARQIGQLLWKDD